MPSADTQFQPGTPKPVNSGRKIGTPNKITKRQREIAEGLDEIVLTLMPDLLKKMEILSRFTDTDFVRAMTRLIAVSAPRGGYGACPREPDDDAPEAGGEPDGEAEVPETQTKEA